MHNAVLRATGVDTSVQKINRKLIRNPLTENSHSGCNVDSDKTKANVEMNARERIVRISFSDVHFRKTFSR